MKKILGTVICVLITLSFGSAFASEKYIFRYSASGNTSNPTNPQPNNPDDDDVPGKGDAAPIWITDHDLGAVRAGTAVDIPLEAQHEQYWYLQKVSGPSWINILNDRLFGTSIETDYGDIAIVVRAFAPSGKYVDRTFTLTLHYGGTPVIGSDFTTPVELGTAIYKPITINWRNMPYSFKDVRSSPEIYLDEEAIAVRGLVTSVGDYWFTATIENIYGREIDLSYVVTVVDTTPPLWANNSIIKVDTTQSVNYPIEVQDESGVANVEFVSGDSWLSFNSASKTIEGSPPSVGTYSITLRATDLHGNSSQKTYSVRVNMPNAATIFTLGGLNSGTYYTGQEIAFLAIFDQPVTVTGSPSLAIEVGGNRMDVPFNTLSGDMIVFKGVIPEGVVGANFRYPLATLSLNGGSIVNRNDGVTLADIHLPAIPSWQLNGIRFEARP